MRLALGLALLAATAGNAVAQSPAHLTPVPPRAPLGHNAAALAAADRAVADMRAIARAPQERILLQHDAMAVSKMKLLLVQRGRRPHQSSSAMGDGGPIISAGGTDGLFDATNGMEETQMSFNLQSQQLQNTLKADGRRFTAISGLMRVKHEVVRNNLASVR